MSNWISVKDRLPKLGKRVLVYREGNILISALTVYNECTFWAIIKPFNDRSFLTRDVTHWQPLPEPHTK